MKELQQKTQQKKDTYSNDTFNSFWNLSLCILLVELYAKYLWERTLVATSGVRDDLSWSSSCLCSCCFIAIILHKLFWTASSLVLINDYPFYRIFPKECNIELIELLFYFHYFTSFYLELLNFLFYSLICTASPLILTNYCPYNLSYRWFSLSRNRKINWKLFSG